MVDTNRSRRSVGAQLYIPHLLEIVARRPVYVRLALRFLHHPAWVKDHTGGVPVDTLQYTRADFGQEAVGGLCSIRAQYTTRTRATRTR